jgi:hypothetical protein
MRRTLALGVLASLLIACSSGGSTPDSNTPLGGNDGSPDGADGGFEPDIGGGDSDLPGFKQITLQPPNAVVKIDLTTGMPVPGTQTYKAIELQGDKEVDVSASTTFTVDDATLGTFAGAVFTSTTALPPGVLGKSTVVHGVPGNGLANVTVIALRVSGDNKDFFFTVPYLKDPDPAKDILKFGTNIKQVDTAILMDTTASMGQEINNLRDALASSTGLIPKLRAAIPNVAVAVARFDDFPVSPFGFPGSATEKADVPYELLSAVSTDPAKAQSAVFLLQAWRGGALPESQYEAQYQLLTGNGYTWTAAVAGSIAKRTPKAGTSGGADFRAGSLPVVVQITDASWFTKEQYSAGTSGGLSPHSHAEVVAAYDAIKAKFVGIHSLLEKTGGGMDTPCDNYANASCDSAKGYQQAVKLAQDTGSVLDPSAFKGCAVGKCCTGYGGAPQDPIGGKCPVVYLAKSDGTGVSDGIVAAIQAISVGAAFDVTAVKSNDPANQDVNMNPVDATKFILKIRAMGEGDVKSGCKARTVKDTDADGNEDTFVAVTVGEPVCFEITPKKNDFVEPAKDRPQFFKAFIDVVGMPGAVKLDRREVLFLVPPKEQGPAK